MKYLVVYDGDLDLNGAYALRTMRDLEAYLRSNCRKNVQAIFKITDHSLAKETDSQVKSLWREWRGNLK